MRNRLILPSRCNKGPFMKRDGGRLIRWLHSYNVGKPPQRQVRLYGIDLSGQYFTTAFHSIEAVLSYLDRANPKLAREARSRYADLISIFRADRYSKLSAAEKDACTEKSKT